MQNVSNNFLAAGSASVRYVKARVEVYSASTLVNTFTDEDRLISINIERIGESSKFFGFSVCQKVNFHLIDKNRELGLSTQNSVKVKLGYKLQNNTIEYVTFPTFNITEVHRNENTNELSITAYDVLYKMQDYLANELTVNLPYTLRTLASAVASKVNTTIFIKGETYNNDYNFSLSYNDWFFDSEDITNLRQLINQICEATQTIAYIDSSNRICFNRLGGAAAHSITKDNYFSLDLKSNRRLQTIVRESETSGNVSASTSNIGSTQYIANNPFLERSDIQQILNRAIAAIGDTTIKQFELNWRGCPALEITDKISFRLKDNTLDTSYVLNDTITFNGNLEQKTSWAYDGDGITEESREFTVAERIKQASATLENAFKKAAAAINGTNGGYVKMLDLDSDGNPDNIFVTDLPISEADIVLNQDGDQYVLRTGTGCQSVIRINNRGMGISSGLNAGTEDNGYEVAITGSGINANVINTGYISANRIKAGIITAEQGDNSWNLNTGVFQSGALRIDNGAASWYDGNSRIGYIAKTGNEFITHMGIVYDKSNIDGINFYYEDTNHDLIQIASISQGASAEGEGGQFETIGTQMGGFIHGRRYGNDTYYSKFGVGSASDVLSFSEYTEISTKNMPNSSVGKWDNQSYNEFYGRVLSTTGTYYGLTNQMTKQGDKLRIRATFSSYGWAKLIIRGYDSNGTRIDGDIELTDWCKQADSQAGGLYVDSTINLPSSWAKWKIYMTPETGSSQYWAGWKDVIISYPDAYRTCSSELLDNDKLTVLGRLDIAAPKYVNEAACIRCQSDYGGVSGWLGLGEDNLKWKGNNISTGSTERLKKEIEQANINALGVINASKIYKYKYKDETDNSPIKYGLVIERECPIEVIDNSGDSINLYSMASIGWKGIQELTQKVTELENRVRELEQQVGE